MTVLLTNFQIIPVSKPEGIAWELSANMLGHPKIRQNRPATPSRFRSFAVICEQPFHPEHWLAVSVSGTEYKFDLNSFQPSPIVQTLDECWLWIVRNWLSFGG